MAIDDKTTRLNEATFTSYGENPKDRCMMNVTVMKFLLQIVND